MNKINKKLNMPEFFSNGSVSGAGCSYATLGYYNDCSRQEIPKLPDNTIYTQASAGDREVGEYKYDKDAKAGTFTSATLPPAVTLAPATTEGYADETPIPVQFKPSYTVPVYNSITTDALSHGLKNGGYCTGYFNIMDAYGAESGSCTVRYVKM